MPPKFGTSGLRGLVSELTPDLVAAHVQAFLRACPLGDRLFVGRDLRESSPAIARSVIGAAQAQGVAVTNCGAVPTPALALAAMATGSAAVMVTGSHIPADRNGLKFYTPKGEITKAEEIAILATVGLPPQTPSSPRGRLSQADPGPAFVARYRNAFGPSALAHFRIGAWSHSAVGRDLLIETLAELGAEIVELGRSKRFLPVDTEAVAPEDRVMLRAAAQEHGLDTIASTDGDGDRPLLTDEAGRVIPGDILGQLTARMLGARLVVTPVSSNTGAESSGFARVIRTKIGSPHVIAGMEALLQDDPAAKVAGYEANGGFLLGFSAQGPAGPLPPLMTRDSHLPIIAPLVLAGKAGLAALVSAEPARFTAADRLTEVSSERAAALISTLSEEERERTVFLTGLGEPELTDINLTDGLRLTLRSGRIVHLRPSGNAPEMRVYTEADTSENAAALLAAALAFLSARLGAGSARLPSAPRH
jgi:phosphomannomutase